MTTPALARVRVPGCDDYHGCPCTKDEPLCICACHKSSVETACTHDGSVHRWREGCPR